MPLHDWSRVESGIFHAFHGAWIAEMQIALNAGLLPSDYYALSEQHTGEYVADVVTLHTPPTPEQLEPPPFFLSGSAGGTALADAPPQISHHEKIELDLLELQRSVSIRHLSTHRIVAIIEIVSPGNKGQQAHYDQFVHKVLHTIRRRISVLLVDVNPTGTFDCNGINASIRNLLAPQATPIVDPPRHSTLATYCSDPPRSVDIYTEHIEPLKPLPDMPIFLTPERYVNVPLESTYIEAWNGMPAFWRNVVLGNPVP